MLSTHAVVVAVVVVAVGGGIPKLLFPVTHLCVPFHCSLPLLVPDPHADTQAADSAEVPAAESQFHHRELLKL